MSSPLPAITFTLDGADPVTVYPRKGDIVRLEMLTGRGIAHWDVESMEFFTRMAWVAGKRTDPDLPDFDGFVDALVDIEVGEVEAPKATGEEVSTG